jgi:hypothetical protein
MKNSTAYNLLICYSRLAQVGIEGAPFSVSRLLKRNANALMHLETERQEIASGEASDEEKDAAWIEFLNQECTAQIEQLDEAKIENVIDVKIEGVMLSAYLNQILELQCSEQ